VSHRTGGLFRILQIPTAYLALQYLVGGRSARQRFVDETVRPFRGARILDVGCGTGSLLDFVSHDVDYVGFDENPAYIESALRRYGMRGRFRCARVGEVLEDDGEFDLVVAMAVLHHLDDDRVHSLLAHAACVLRPDGAFVSMDATLHEGQSWASRMLARADRGGRVRTPAAYRALLDAHFDDVEDRVLTDLLRVPYSHYVARARRRLAD